MSLLSVYPIRNIWMPVSDQLSAENQTNPVSSSFIACTVDVPIMPIEGVAGTHTSAAAVDVERVVDTLNASNINATKHAKGTCTLHYHLVAI